MRPSQIHGLIAAAGLAATVAATAYGETVVRFPVDVVVEGMDASTLESKALLLRRGRPAIGSPRAELESEV